LPKKKAEDPFKCPKCGYRVNEPEKTWTVVSPIPDKYGRVSITIMGSFKCPNCGYSWEISYQKDESGEGGEDKFQSYDRELLR
jgi:hypothetical protein